MKRFIIPALVCFFIACSCMTVAFAQDVTESVSSEGIPVEGIETQNISDDKEVISETKLPDETRTSYEEEAGTAEVTTSEKNSGNNIEIQDGNEAADIQSTNEPSEDSMLDDGENGDSSEQSGEDVRPDGWNEDHSAYYEDNEPVTDRLIKDGEVTYYVDSTGKASVADGVVKTGGKTYYFDDGKGIKKGWVNCSDGFLRYGLGDGLVATRVTKIGKKLYYFTSNGKAYKKGFVTYNGATYYSRGKGLLATGYNAIGKYGYYFYKSTGKMAKNTKIGYLKIGKSGKLHGAYAKGIKVLNKKGWKLKAAYKWAYKLRYAHRWMRRKTSEKYAYYGFTKKKGNCFVMAATFYTMGKLLGYDIHQVKGYVNGKHPHSWTVIKLGKKEWVFDPNFRNETGRNGWKIYYGKKGTWRYNRYKKMN